MPVGGGRAPAEGRTMNLPVQRKKPRRLSVTDRSLNALAFSFDGKKAPPTSPNDSAAPTSQHAARYRWAISAQRATSIADNISALAVADESAAEAQITSRRGRIDLQAAQVRARMRHAMQTERRAATLYHLQQLFCDIVPLCSHPFALSWTPRLFPTGALRPGAPLLATRRQPHGNT